MISQSMKDGCASKYFSEEVEKSVHDSSVSSECCFPNTMITHITSVIDHIRVWMLTSDVSESVFDRSPWCATVSVITPETLDTEKIYRRMFNYA